MAYLNNKRQIRTNRRYLYPENLSKFDNEIKLLDQYNNNTMGLEELLMECIKKQAKKG